MQFCTDCGSVLNLFEFPDEEICYTCRKAKEKVKPPSVAQNTTQHGTGLELGSLEQATLSQQNEQLVLLSPEGWTLWSGHITASTPLKTIIDRAQRILEIRQKRNNSK